MSNLVKYAEDELARIDMSADSEEIENKMMRKHILHMVEEFSKEGHSGFSASYAISVLSKLLNYEPLTPLTGDDDEWTLLDERTTDGDPEMKWQNKRLFSVFKTADGRAYDTGAKIYYPKGKRNETFTRGGERDYITFPYTRKIEYIEVDE